MHFVFKRVVCSNVCAVGLFCSIKPWRVPLSVGVTRSAQDVVCRVGIAVCWNAMTCSLVDKHSTNFGGAP